MPRETFAFPALDCRRKSDGFASTSMQTVRSKRGPEPEKASSSVKYSRRWLPRENSNETKSFERVLINDQTWIRIKSEGVVRIVKRNETRRDVVPHRSDFWNIPLVRFLFSTRSDNRKARWSPDKQDYPPTFYTSSP